MPYNYTLKQIWLFVIHYSALSVGIEDLLLEYRMWQVENTQKISQPYLLLN